MIRFCAIVTVVLLSRITVCAQNNSGADGLQRLLLNAKEDSAGVELYLSAGADVENTNSKLAADYYSKALLISKKISNKRTLAKSMIYYSAAMYLLGKSDSGFYYNREALSLSKQSGDTLYAGICLMNMAMVSQQTGEDEQALEYLLEGRRLIEKSQDENIRNIEMQMYASLQTVYNGRSEFDKSIMAGKEAMFLARQLKNKSSEGYALLNLSVAYRETQKADSAELMAKEALNIAVVLKDKRMEAASLLAIASVWEKQLQYKKILPYLERTYQLINESGAIDIKAETLIGLGICYLQLKDFAKAEQFAREGLELSRQQQLAKEEATALRTLSRIAYAKGNMDEGAELELKAQELTDRFVQNTISKQSAQLDKKYETEKKNNQIQKLNQDRKLKSLWNYVLAGSFITLLLLSLLSYRTYRQKQKLQQQQIAELEKEKQLLAAQAVLKGQEEERTRLAKDLHDGLGGMLSGIKHSFNTMKGNLILTPENAEAFERSMNMLDSSIKELRMVAHNLMPESLLKFGLATALKDFCEHITASGALRIAYHTFGMENVRLESNTEITLYRVIQELVNNIIKHAQASEAIVQLQKEEGILTVTVEDNGKGFDEQLLETARGMGWNNIRNRIDYLKGRLNIASTAGKGTGITIELGIA